MLFGFSLAEEPIISSAQSYEALFEKIFGHKPERECFSVAMDLFWDGHRLGEISVDVPSYGEEYKVYSKEFLYVVKDRINPEVYSILSQNMQGDQYLAISLNSLSLDVYVDQITRKFNVSSPVVYRDTTVVDLQDYEGKGLYAEVLEPNDLLAYINFEWEWENSSYGIVRGFRHEPVFVMGDYSMSGVISQKATLGQSPEVERFQIYKDDYENNESIVLGDYNPDNEQDNYDYSFVGLFNKREFSFDPEVNKYPKETYSLMVTRDQYIDLFINDVFYDSLYFKDGKYKIVNFPLQKGLNKIEFVRHSDGDSGDIRELAWMIRDTNLLAKGLNEFSYGAGIPFGLIDNKRDFRKAVYAHLYYQQGIDKYSTVGGVFQGSVYGNQRHYLTGAHWYLATGLGLFRSGIKGCYLDGRLGGKGSISLSSYSNGWLTNHNIQTALTHTGKDYRDINPYGAAVATNDMTLLQLVDYYKLGRSYYLTLESQLSIKQGAYDSGRVLAGVIVNWGNLRAKAAIGAEDDTVAAINKIYKGTLTYYLPMDDWNGFVKIFIKDGWKNSAENKSLLFGLELREESLFVRQASDILNASNSLEAKLEGENRDFIIDSSFDITDEDSRYQVNGFYKTGDHTVKAGIENRADLSDQTLEYYYDSEYMQLDLLHSQSAQQRAKLRTTLVMIDGLAILSRPIKNNFVISTFKDNHNTEEIWWKQKGIGAAPVNNVLTNFNQYRDSSVYIDTHRLPFATVVEPSIIRVRPERYSGYHVSLKKSKEILVYGKLLDKNSQAYKYVTGKIVPYDGEENKPISFITNRNGIFQILKLKAGRYVLKIDGNSNNLKQIVVPKSAENIYNLGKIELGGVR